MGVLPLEVSCVLLTVVALRINRAGVICARVVWSKFLEAVSTSAKRNFLNRGRNSLHDVHSVECLHVVRLVESHICTKRRRIDLERVYPLMKLGNNFRWRGTFAWIGCQM